MFCIKCGKEISDGARFCRHCGEPQPVIVTVTPPSEAEAEAKEEAKKAAEKRPMPAVNSDRERIARQEQTGMILAAAFLAACIAAESDEIKRLLPEGFDMDKSPLEEIVTLIKDSDPLTRAVKAELAFLQNDLKENLAALNSVYEAAKVIPEAFRTAEKLYGIYKNMNGSGFDMEKAVELADRKANADLLKEAEKEAAAVRADLTEGLNAAYAEINGNEAIQSELLSNNPEAVRSQCSALGTHNNMLSNLSEIRNKVFVGNYLDVSSAIRQKTASMKNNAIQNAWGL